MAELKKCPFCGSEVKIIAEQVDARTVAYEFRCQNLDCCSMTSFDYCDREEAIASWNNRATEAEIRVSVIDEFAEKLKTEYIHYDIDDALEHSIYTSYSKNILALEEYVDKLAEQLKEG